MKDNYACARTAGYLRESSLGQLSELETQARLFAGEYGTQWKTTDGQEIELLHFGEWNREAGPDFKGAKVRFSDGKEKMGDLEVDRDARDWERHGHATNPAFADVLFQFFIRRGKAAAFARTSENRAVAQIEICLEKSCAPISKNSTGTVDPAVATIMIEEAAEFRLRTKHASHVRAVFLHGPDNALFHAMAAGMGYKNNAVPFLLVAQRIGLRNAASSSGEARLFGLAGFLEPRTFDKADKITRQYLKPLWDDWWIRRDAMSRLVLPKEMWKLSGIRPANHPHRRLGALAATAREFAHLRRAIRSSETKGFQKFFRSLAHPYWTTHWNLSASCLDHEMVLVGSDRIQDLLINAFLPSLPLEQAREELSVLPGPTPSGRIRKASEWLVGKLEPKFWRTARDQQGLLQLYSDFASITAQEAWTKIQSSSTATKKLK